MFAREAQDVVELPLVPCDGRLRFWRPRRTLPNTIALKRLLRGGDVDLETGVVGRRSGPEVRAVVLFRDRFVGLVREGHALCQGEVTAELVSATPW